jgi:DNA-binding NarL/FixJ family response regulator
VADDHAVVRHGISATLAEAPDIDVVAEAADGSEALTKARRLRPDVVVADVRMPQLGGIELAAALREQDMASQVIMLSAYSQGTLIAEAMRAGAQGYLLKETSGPELIDAVRAVHRGEIVLLPTAAGEFARRVRDAGEAGFVERLTPRQREVLGLVARGLRNKEIARELAISEATVKFHMIHIFEKLGVGGRTEAVGKATELGILTPP